MFNCSPTPPPALFTMLTFLHPEINLTGKIFPSALHPASPSHKGFEAVLTQQPFEWFVYTVVLCLLVTIHSFGWLTAYKFLQCQGSRYIHYLWLLAYRTWLWASVVWATITFCCRWIFYTSRNWLIFVQPHKRRCTPCVGLPAPSEAHFCVMSGHQML